MQHLPRAVGIEQARWHWKVVRQFVSERFGITLERSACRNYLQRLGFVVKRPEKRLLKANETKRAAFVAEYAALRVEARATGTKHFFVDEAHFYADVDPHGMWVLRLPALVDSTSPRYGEKASYYSAVCLETGEVEAMPLTGNSSAETSVAFLQQLRAHHAGRSWCSGTTRRPMAATRCGTTCARPTYQRVTKPDPIPFRTTHSTEVRGGATYQVNEIPGWKMTLYPSCTPGTQSQGTGGWPRSEPARPLPPPHG